MQLETITGLGIVFTIAQELPLSDDVVGAPDTKYISDGPHEVELPSVHSTPGGSVVILKQVVGEGSIRDAVSQHSLDDVSGETVIVQSIAEDTTVGFILTQTFGKKKWMQLPPVLFGGSESALTFVQIPSQTIREIHVPDISAVSNILSVHRPSGKAHHFGNGAKLLSARAKWGVLPSTETVLTILKNGSQVFTDDLVPGGSVDTHGNLQEDVVGLNENLFGDGDEIRLAHVSGPVDGLGLTIVLLFEEAL